MFRIITTLVMVAIAAVAVLSQYQNYAENPWTRDGQVRAHIIQITPRVTGPVTNVLVDDNSRVKKGQLLFEIDPSIYQAELSNAKAKQMQASALLDKAKNENHRAVELESLKHGTVSELDLNNFQNAVQTAKANLAAADAVVEQAELNVAYTHITAPTDGFITNLNLRQGAQVVAICNKLEAEIAELDDDEKNEFLQDLGMNEAGLDRLIRAGYELLGLQTYFTAGVKEVRAWTVSIGATAPQGAGVIHTDFEKGFIRAEVISYEHFIEFNGEQGAKDAGKWRLEGKDYVLKDGDVIHYRFNV